MSTVAAVEERVVRVFVSSTFRDMQAERDELVLRIFPQLRRLCEERGVEWGEIDLRWGVTEEQAKHGEVLPICFREIKRCRPFFVGLLGERYGWIPNIPEDLLENEPWIREYGLADEKRSATELEILYGVLNNPEVAEHAFFYFRDPAFAESLPPERRNDFEAEDVDSHQRLALLKVRIRQAHLEGKLKHEPRLFADAKVLGAQLLADFMTVINDLYPPDRNLSLLERDRLDHRAFARSRAQIYIRSQEYFDRLRDHVAGDGPPLIVLGPSGSGKSALISNWALQYEERHPDDFVLLHFVGASPNSAHTIDLLKRIMLELKQHFDLTEDVPLQNDQIRKAFPEWLVRTANRGRIILVIDGLDRLADIDNAPDLGWLPRVFPKNCRLVLSMLPGRSLEAVKSRGWMGMTPPLRVQPLSEEHRRRLIQDFLSQYARTLDVAPTDRLVRAKQSSNPLYLRVLLDELRVFGSHERLNERISWYLEAQSPSALYRKVINRWDEAYAGGSTLVRDTLSLLWAARNGLSETELLQAMGEGGRPLPRALWSPLFFAMSDSLVCHHGLLGFGHEFLRAAARDECVPTEHDQQEAHRRLARYFQRQSSGSSRRLEELPWQLMHACEVETLKGHLCDLSLFPHSDSPRWNDWMLYWRSIEEQYSPAKCYIEQLHEIVHDGQSRAANATLSLEIGRFLGDLGHTPAAIQFVDLAQLLSAHPSDSKPWFTAACANTLADLYSREGNNERAITILDRWIKVHEGVRSDREVLANALNTLSIIYIRRGEEAEQLATLRSRKSRIQDGTPYYLLAHDCSVKALVEFERRYGFHSDECLAARSQLGATLCELRHYNEAERVLRESVGMHERRYGRKDVRTATAQQNLALVLAEGINLREAFQLCSESVEVTRQILGENHLDTLMIANNLALLYQKSASEGMSGAYRRSSVLWLDTLLRARRHLGKRHPLLRTVQLHLLSNIRDLSVRMAIALALQLGAVGLGALSPWFWVLGTPMALAGVFFEIQEFKQWCCRSPLDLR